MDRATALRPSHRAGSPVVAAVAAAAVAAATDATLIPWVALQCPAEEANARACRLFG